MAQCLDIVVGQDANQKRVTIRGAATESRVLSASGATVLRLMQVREPQVHGTRSKQIRSVRPSEQNGGVLIG